MLKDLGYKQSVPRILFTDSANAISLVINPLKQGRTRHIDIRYKWIINRVKNRKEIQLAKIGTTEMAADGLTKLLLAEKHRQFIQLLKLKYLEEIRTSTL